MLERRASTVGSLPLGAGDPPVGVNPEGDCMEITVTLTVTLQYPSVTLQYPSLTRYSV